MKKTDIFYINYDGSSCSVYESQIYNYCSALKNNNLKVTLINCDKEASQPCHWDSFQVIQVKKGRFDFIIKRRLVNEISTIIEEEASEKIVLHCRGAFGGCLGLRVKRKIKNETKVISDIRGAAAEEYIMRYRHRNILWRLLARIGALWADHVQKRVYSSSDYIFCVSKKLEEYLNTRFHINCRMLVVPTCIEGDKGTFDAESRSSIRKKLKFENRFVLVYSGGGQEYQNPEGMAELFKALSSSINNAYFFVLTRDKDIFRDAFNKYGIDAASYSIKHVPQHMVHHYLSAGDCAVLIREESLVNKVASPTKFAEYVNCRLPVLISRGIGDIDEINRVYPVCIYDDQIECFKYIYQHIISHEENFSLLIENYYNLENRMKDIISIYGG